MNAGDIISKAYDFAAPDENLMPPRQSIGFLFSDIARLSRLAFNRRAAPIGLSLAQWRVLATLTRQEGLSQVRLAEILEIQPMTLVRQIDRLEALGLVARRPDPADRRAVRLMLTTAADPLIAEMRRIADELWAAALADFDPAERAALEAQLARIKSALCAEAGCHSETEPQSAADETRS